MTDAKEEVKVENKEEKPEKMDSDEEREEA